MEDIGGGHLMLLWPLVGVWPSTEPLFGAFFWPWVYFTYAEVRISRQQGFVLWVLGLEYMSASPNFIVPPDTFALAFHSAISTMQRIAAHI